MHTSLRRMAQATVADVNAPASGPSTGMPAPGTEAARQQVPPQLDPDSQDRYAARRSYFGRSGYSMSQGLQRARAPFRFRNTLTGMALAGFITSVYYYSISAVKQEDFSDVEISNQLVGATGHSQESNDTLTSANTERGGYIPAGNPGLQAPPKAGAVPPAQPAQSRSGEGAVPDAVTPLLKLGFAGQGTPSWIKPADPSGPRQV
ncbi:uncharacterized protein L969DRAFT_46850 [Mixia osmundae IAM 14324]|uniref:Cytochrome c oxidase assembly factor 3 n=1 Tax=Mixia osmundae (strain CBS 9802 / IAM 14324 / JCM 22182 / KY 12970) TaxID=764103 RepID=G7EAQ1_MIXOS|nr:uncharacterized protein L969DRAFT_46850 [Mixia osmundae IAM 14324]KEI40880.1 hypothetical protein L969DRAFT_46850 [Mixia osmundae IAM 14324]GAA99911.1 hypothetical protein E5Q_06614 [Mixia osmundae IAM 14324]